MCGRTGVCIIVRTAALAAVLASVLASVFVAVLVAAATRAAETLTPVPSRRSQTSAAQGASVSRIAVLALTTHGGAGVLTTAVAKVKRKGRHRHSGHCVHQRRCRHSARREPSMAQRCRMDAALARLPRWRWPILHAAHNHTTHNHAPWHAPRCVRGGTVVCSRIGVAHGEAGVRAGVRIWSRRSRIRAPGY